MKKGSKNNTAIISLAWAMAQKFSDRPARRQRFKRTAIRLMRQHAVDVLQPKQLRAFLKVWQYLLEDAIRESPKDAPSNPVQTPMEGDPK